MPRWGVVGRQQFNVTLPPDLVRRLKHHAVDVQLSASHLVEQLLLDQLDQLDQPRPPAPPGPLEEPTMADLELQPMVHVQDVAASVSFYEALGAQVVHGSRDGDFVVLALGGAQLSLLGHPPNPEQGEGAVELHFTSRRDLDAVEAALRGSGTRIARRVTDEGFGRQLQVMSPDGLLIKINELDPELYT